MSGCVETVTVPLGGARLVTSCGRLAVETIDGADLCRLHADARRYQDREFERQLANATRHSKQIGTFDGTWCLCGVFVPDGIEHPWGVPARVEDAAR